MIKVPNRGIGSFLKTTSKEVASIWMKLHFQASTFNSHSRIYINRNNKTIILLLQFTSLITLSNLVLHQC